MSVTTFNYTSGGNTKKVVVLNELGNGSTNIIAGVEAAITSLGWTLYDSVNTTLFNPIITRVYRSPCADGVAFKYWIMRWDTVKLMLTTSVCEVWNTLAKIPQNESWQNFGAFNQGYDLVNCYFLINGSARHLVIWNFILGTPGLWTGCLEFERIAPEDTVTSPGGSIQFNGTTDYLTVPNTATTLNIGGAGVAFTIEAWIFTTLAPGIRSQHIVSQDNATLTASNSNFIWIVNTAGVLNFTSVSNAGAQVSVAGNSPILPNQWHHVMVSSDGTTLRMFVNGILQTNTSTAYAIGTNSLVTGIGSTNNGGASTFFQGLITKLRIVRGSALATSGFGIPFQSQVPTNSTQYGSTAITGTQLFLGVTSSGNYIVDTSTNGYTVTAVGTPAFNATSYFSGANPNFAWTNGLTIGTPLNGSVVGTFSNYSFGFPRLPFTAALGIGLRAVFQYVAVTNRGPMPPQNANYSYNGAESVFGSAGMLGSYYAIPYGWNTASAAASSISVDAVSGTLAPFGRAFNFGVIARTNGQPGDTILANIDIANGWPSSTARTQVECLALPMYGGADGASTLATTNQSPLSWGNVNVSSAGPGGQIMVPMKSIAVGDTIFTAMGNSQNQAGSGSICSFQISGGSFQLPVVRTFVPGGVYDIVFDGNGYIWGSTANGVVRMDANTFTTSYFTSNQTIANGCGYLGIDNKNVYAVSRLANTKAQIYTIDRATGNVWFGNSFNGNTAFTVASSWGTPQPDYLGNVIVGQVPGTTSAQTQFQTQFQSNTGQAWAYVGQSIGSGTGTQNYGVNTFYDPIGWNGIPRSFIFTSHPAGSNFQVHEISTTGNLAILQLSQTAITTTVGLVQTNFYGTTGPADQRGDMTLIPYRGQHIIGYKKPGFDIRSASNQPYSYLVSLCAQVGKAEGNPLFISTNNPGISILERPTGQSNWATTNGIHIFHSFSSPQTVNNNVYVQSGLYNPGTALGAATSRLLLKG
jgi:hypothetical protein